MHGQVDDSADLGRRTLLAIAAMAPALAAGVSSAEAAPTATAELPPDLAKALDDYDQATLGNDVATLGNLVAEDYMLVNSDSTVQNKGSYLADFEVPGFRVDPYVLEQAMMKTWGNAALIGGLLHLGWWQDGVHQQRLLRIAHVWVRYDDRWWLTYTQLTRVPE